MPCKTLYSKSKGWHEPDELDAYHRATLVSLGHYIVSGQGQDAAILKKHYSTATDRGVIKLAETFIAPERLDYSENNVIPTKIAK